MRVPSNSATSTLVGGSGLSRGTTGSEPALGAPDPAELEATTVTVYATPFDSPVIVQPRGADIGATDEERQLRPPGAAVAT